MRRLPAHGLISRERGALLECIGRRLPAQRGQGERSSQQIAEPFAYVGAMAVNDRTMSSQRGDDAEIGVVDVQQVVRSGASLEIDPHKLGDPKRQREKVAELIDVLGRAER